MTSRLEKLLAILDDFEEQGRCAIKIGLHPQTAEEIGLSGGAPLVHRHRTYWLHILSIYKPNKYAFTFAEDIL